MIILFDGVCNLCNGFVQFVIKRDRAKVFHFASLQSGYGVALSSHFNLLTEVGPNTVILYDGDKILTKSNAVIKIVSSLNGIWKCVLIFKIIPCFIRDRIYNLLARNRYKLFGKREQCMVPDEDIKDRFMDNKKFTLK